MDFFENFTVHLESNEEHSVKFWRIFSEILLSYDFWKLVILRMMGQVVEKFPRPYRSTCDIKIWTRCS